MLDELCPVLVFEDDVSLPEPLFYAASHYGVRRLLQGVAFRIQPRSARLDRLLGIEHKREDLVVDVNEIYGLLRRIFVDCRDCHDFITRVTRNSRKRRHLIERGRAPLVDRDARHVGSGDDRFYTRQGGSPARVNLNHPRVRMRAPQDFDIEHTGEVDI